MSHSYTKMSIIRGMRQKKTWSHESFIHKRLIRPYKVMPYYLIILMLIILWPETITRFFPVFVMAQKFRVL